MSDNRVVIWHGELLWPQSLPDGKVIDLRDVSAAGVWVFDWFRQHPNRAVVGGPPVLKRQLRRAGVPVLWFERIEDALNGGGGVSPSERDMLWN